MQADGYHGSSILRQEALRAVKSARLMDLLVPSWILVFLISEKFPKASD